MVVVPAPQSEGPSGSSNGMKSHCTGSVRSSTAAIAFETWSQSAADIVPTTVGVASSSTVSS